MQWAAKLSALSLRVSLPLAVVALLMLASDGWCQQELRSGKKGVTNPAPVTSTAIDADTQALDVAIKAGSISLSGADGATLDGVNSAIRATVFDRTNSNPLAVQTVDSNGDPVSAGGGTQYNQGTATTDTDTLTMAGCVRADTAVVATGVIDGDRARCIVDSTGRLWVHVGVIDGTVAATQSGAWNINSITTLPALSAGSNTIGGVNLSQYTPVTGRLPVDGSGVTQPVSGTVTANAGTGTFAVSGTTFDGIIKDGTGDTTQANVSGGRVHVDGSGVTQPVSGTVTVGTFPDNEPFNLAQIGGNAVSTGVGASGTGTQRTAAILHDGTDTAQVTATGGGSLQVECTAGCAGSGGTSAADNSAFTGGTTNVTPMGALYDTTPPAVTDGNIGAPRMNSSRQLMVDCVAGCAGGSSTPADNFANPTTAGLSQSFSMWWDGTNWDRASGNQTDGLLVNLGANNDVTVTGTVTANAGTNLNTSALALESGGNLAGLNGKLPSTAALADNTANPTVSGIAAYMMCFDGTTWDRCGAAASSTAILAGQQAVTGTAAALATNTIKHVCVKALLANTINIYVGPSGVTTSTGLELGPGDSYCTEVSNTNVLFVIASGSGPSVSWAARNF